VADEQLAAVGEQVDHQVEDAAAGGRGQVDEQVAAEDGVVGAVLQEVALEQVAAAEADRAERGRAQGPGVVGPAVEVAGPVLDLVAAERVAAVDAAPAALEQPLAEVDRGDLEALRSARAGARRPARRAPAGPPSRPGG
jgi:hypothetical protein